MASHFPVYTLNGSFNAGPRVHTGHLRADRKDCTPLVQDARNVTDMSSDLVGRKKESSNER